MSTISGEERGDAIAERGQDGRTFGAWPSADCSKKRGSAAFTASAHWAFDKKILARVGSIRVEMG